MTLALIIAMTKRVMEVVIVLIMMLKTTQTREIMMKKNLTPLYIKIIF